MLIFDRLTPMPRTNYVSVIVEHFFNCRSILEHHKDHSLSLEELVITYNKKIDTSKYDRLGVQRRANKE